MCRDRRGREDFGLAEEYSKMLMGKAAGEPEVS
jgi:hypothetical protein